ncbi:MAG: histidine kinase [Sulfurimonas sp.]|nr:histidine kinase [Sulfurimonas sp.]
MKKIKNNFTIKLISAFLVFGISLLTVSFFAIFKLNENTAFKHAKANAQLVYNLKTFQFDTYINDIVNKLSSINESVLFCNYLQNNQDLSKKTILKELLLSISKTNSNIMQLRYIDLEGSEIIRVERESYKSEPVFVEDSKLQNKKHRYYFKQVNELFEDEVWYSKIDLNIEHQKIQKPIKPVLRVGIPVVRKSIRKGILIINVFMNDFLKTLIMSSEHDVFLMDKDNYIIVSTLNNKNWSRYLNIDSDLENEFEIDDLKAIRAEKNYISNNVYSDRLNFNNGEDIKIILRSKREALEAILSENSTTLLMVMFSILLLSIPLALVLSKVPIRLQTELKNLNTYLESRIEKAILVHKQEQKYLLQQNKLANLGEMLSMIAHQWRQPLASISAISGTLTIDIMMDKYNGDFFKKRLESIGELSTHLSSTIDDFRSFFKENKEPQSITLKEIVDGALQIIGPTLGAKNISINVDIEDNIRVNTYVNEVKQVLLNILKNAEDALVEQNDKDLKVWISAELDKKFAHLNVQDNAGGIPEDIIETIFEPYFTTKSAKDGTGLGLYMSKTIIEEHCNGKLSVVNSEDGAKFIISLPLN